MHANRNIIMTQQPMFSVIIATYNRAQLLQRTLKSLVLQTEKEWEAIIVDDGSTDDTYKQILPYLKSCPRIKYILRPHMGEFPSRNYGIIASCGKFITFLDSDDEYLPDHLESRKRFIVQNPDVTFFFGGAKILGNQYTPDKNNPAIRIHLNDCVIGGTFIIERETLLSLDGYGDILLGSDNDLFERAKSKRIKMAEIKLPTYIYHHENPDSITNTLYLKVKDP
jgi:glycosyltransferase involved in cell wall biosynthesis